MNPLPGALCEKNIDSTSLISVATLKKGISIKERLKAVLSPAALEEFLTNGFGNQDTRKEKAELGQEI